MDLHLWLLIYLSGAGATALFFCIAYLYYWYNESIRFTFKDFLGVVAGTVLWPGFWVIWIASKVGDWLTS